MAEKIEYTAVSAPDVPFVWCYSWRELEAELRARVLQTTLKVVLVGLDGYLERGLCTGDFFDFSYLGGSVLLLFGGNVALECEIHALGMIRYRFHRLSELVFRRTYGDLPQDLWASKSYFYPVGREFSLPCEGQTVVDVRVDAADSYAFFTKGFDRDRASLAAAQNLLPGGIRFTLQNGVVLSLVGDELEYFFIELSKRERGGEK